MSGGDLMSINSTFKQDYYFNSILELKKNALCQLSLLVLKILYTIAQKIGKFHIIVEIPWTPIHFILK